MSFNIFITSFQKEIVYNLLIFFIALKIAYASFEPQKIKYMKAERTHFATKQSFTVYSCSNLYILN